MRARTSYTVATMLTFCMAAPERTFSSVEMAKMSYTAKTKPIRCTVACTVTLYMEAKALIRSMARWRSCLRARYCANGKKLGKNADCCSCLCTTAQTTLAYCRREAMTLCTATLDMTTFTEELPTIRYGVGILERVLIWLKS
eukprot:scaffold442_cov397-Prasinococcus_capsulatus_cf.AAC.56